MFSLTFSAVALFAATHAGAQPQAAAGRLKKERFKGREVVAGQVLVKFSNSAGPQDVERAKGAADVESERKVGGKGVRLFQSRSKDAETLVREFSARGDVVYAEPNYVIRASAVPDDPRFGEQWALLNTGYTAATGNGTPGADIGATAAWEISTGSRANVVAVVDTGVDHNHPDLAANMWSAPAAFTVNIGGQAIRCEAGTHGFNAVTKTCDPTDEYDHGTHVAGILGAAGNNGVGGAGVNWTASIMDIKFIDATGSGTLADAIDAIQFAIQAKQALGAGANVRVLSNSWGWNGEAAQSLLDEINHADQSGMLFVAGSGNGGEDRVGDNNEVSPFYPASYDAPNVVSVAATDNNDALASFSNYSATRVHLAAPGVLVLSTIMGNRYDFWSGTSMATPQVSGAAALVLSRCALDTAGLKNALLNNVDRVASLSGYTATGGRLNVGKAISSCTPAGTPTATPTPAATATPTPTPTPTPAATPTPTPSPTPAPPAAGAATANRLAKFMDAAGSVANSTVSEVGGTVGIGTDNPDKRYKLDVRGHIVLGTTRPVSLVADFPGNGEILPGGFFGSLGTNSFTFAPSTDYGNAGAQVKFAYFNGVRWLSAMEYANVAGGGVSSLTLMKNGGNVGVGTANPQSTLQINGYVQLALTPGAPPAADCDAEAEYGRMKVDAVSVKLYVCTAAGWKSAALQ